MTAKTDKQDFLAYLVAQNIITTADRGAAEQQAEKMQKTAEEVIIEKDIVGEEELFRRKSDFLKLPLHTFEAGESVPKEILEEVSDEVAAHYRFVPIAKTDSYLEIGMVDPTDLKAQEAIKFLAMKSDLPIKTTLITFSDFNALTKQYKTLTGEATDALEKLAKELSEEEKTETKKKKRTVSATIFEEAPITKLVAVIIKHAYEGKASDVHIEPTENDLRVRYRVDGILHTSLVLPRNVHAAVIARLKILCDMKIDESRIPQDGRFKIAMENKTLDFRVSVFPTQKGEKAALRILDPAAGERPLGDLGIMGRNEELFGWAMKQPYGMILITGPTGSGKSTTLSALLKLINKEAINITTLEDPVEYEVNGANQSQIMPEIGYTFARGLRHILRQDPDVIMVGEIRDQESAALAVQSALTGHLFFSTLHTNNAIGVVPRLIDMNIEKYLLPSSLLLMVAQRLVKKICEDCKEKKEAPDWAKEVIDNMVKDIPKEELQRYDVAKKPYYIYEGKGCNKCAQKGTRGRIGIFEMFKMNDEVEDIILTGVSEHKLRDAANKQGMITLQQDAVLKLLQGIIPVTEALAVIRDQATEELFKEVEGEMEDEIEKRLQEEKKIEEARQRQEEPSGTLQSKT